MMAGEEVSSSGITKFNGSNYAYWWMEMEDYLFNKKLHLPMGAKLKGLDVDELNLLDRQILGVIQLSLSNNVAHNVVKEKMIVGMMQTLVDMYEKPLANNKVYLMKKLFNLRMPEGGLVVEHFNSFNTMVNQLVSVGIKFDNKICALILLASVPNSWEPMRAATTNSIRNAIIIHRC